MPASERVPPDDVRSSRPRPSAERRLIRPGTGQQDGRAGGRNSSAPVAGGAAGTEVLTHGKLTVLGRLPEASNAALYCVVEHEGIQAHCIYKPIAGERPLWDFPHGTLAAREVATYLVSEATGWSLVPPTVLRDGPHGAGMCQLWIEAGSDAQLLALVETDRPGPGWKAVAFANTSDGRPALLVHADDVRLRRLAVLDAVINNADRKGGHLLPARDGRLYAIDHGVTFHTEDKLRTLLWGWVGEPLTAEALEVLGRLAAELAAAPAGRLAAALSDLLAPDETEALRARVAALLAAGRHPEPSGRWPAIPWPPV